MWDPYAEFQSATLANGLSVHAAHWPGRPWEAMGFLVHSGAENDPVGLEGLSHFVEHVVSGNAKMSKDEMKKFFENCGGSCDLGVTGYPSTSYRFFVPIDNAVISKALSMFGDILCSVKLERVIEQERQIIIGEFNQSYPNEFDIDLDLRKHKTIFAGSFLERFLRPLGMPESIARITQKDLQLYYDTNYTPSNISIVGVGGMELAGLLEKISESPFAAHKPGMRTPLPLPLVDLAPPSETRHVVGMSEYVNIPIKVGRYQSVGSIPGNINRRAITVMRGMINKALNEEVRERRAWTYDISSPWHNFRQFYGFAIDCNAFVLEALGEIEGVINQCIDSIAENKKLFEHVRGSYIASIAMSDSTGRGVCKEVIRDLETDNVIISLRDILDGLESLTMDDVRSALHFLQPDRRWTLIVKP